MVILCFWCLLICYLLRTVLSVAILPIRIQHAVYQDEQLTALVLSAFYWGYILSQVAGSVLAQRYGGKVRTRCWLQLTRADRARLGHFLRLAILCRHTVLR
jgi:ACS family sodium-dependent inorganic phosphate cotransporter